MSEMITLREHILPSIGVVHFLFFFEKKKGAEFQLRPMRAAGVFLRSLAFAYKFKKGNELPP